MSLHLVVPSLLFFTDISSSTPDLMRTSESSTLHVSEKELSFEAEPSSKSVGRGTSAFGEVGAVTRGKVYSSSAADDMLPSEDIVRGGFQWRTPLVVLSACNTSRGQVTNSLSGVRKDSAHILLILSKHVMPMNLDSEQVGILPGWQLSPFRIGASKLRLIP